MKLFGASVLIALGFILGASPAETATFQVTNNSDGGPGSLRDAITQANSTPGNSTIQISVQGSIALLSPLPDLTGDTIITGPGADKLVISPTANTSAQTNPIFLVDAGAVVSINGVSIGALGSTIIPDNGGSIITRLGQAGAVTNRGMLTLANCVLSGNSAPQFGGAISNFGDLVVRQSTLSDNIAQGELGNTGGNAFGGAIGNFGNLWIINSTISGNQAAAADGVSGDFLIRKNSGTADQTDSDMYYGVVDPNNTRQTLEAWWTTNGFNPDGSSPNGATAAQAAYLNNNDLGFGRDMHILQQGDNVASYVSNYTVSLDHSSPDQNPLSADAAEAKDPARAVATVCMEYSPIDNDPSLTPVVKFFVFNGTGPNAVRVDGADLDGKGQKFTPQLCMVCHGGTPPPSHGETLSTVLNMHSSFREFDIASFKFSRPGTRVDDPSRSVPTSSEEAAFKGLNQLVLSTNPAPAIQELINGWYAGGASTQDTSFVPPGWVDGAHPEEAQLYRNVVATSCRTCHVAQQSFDFSTYAGFASLRGAIQFDVLGASTKLMPHAKVTFANFWRQGRANTLANFSGPNWAAIGTGNITGNQGATSLGGAIYDAGSTVVVASTIALNTAVAGIGTSNGNADAGGLRPTGTSTLIGNSLIADNFTHDMLFGSQDMGGTISSAGFNLIGNTSGVTITNPQPNDITDIQDPGIATLAFNGGTTPSHALLPGSPAIDQGGSADDPVTGDSITRDQRSYVRTSVHDIGAFEFAGTIPKALGNISTRGFVQTGNNVLIAGLIISGNGAKQVILRALGPTLGQSPFNVPNVLANPTLELRDGNGALIISNDNWGSASNAAAINSSGYAPPNNLESAILISLDPGNYTAIVRGVNNTTGIALVEGYDLDPTAASKFGNISTRGFVGTGANVMIAGVIVHGPDSENVIIRGLGPTLTQFEVPSVLADPILDLRDSNGNLLMTNDNWKDGQQSQIEGSGFAPPSDLESAIAVTLTAGNYTAILRGKNNTTGNGLVEVYELN